MWLGEPSRSACPPGFVVYELLQHLHRRAKTLLGWSDSRKSSSSLNARADVAIACPAECHGCVRQWDAIAKSRDALPDIEGKLESVYQNALRG